MKKLALTFVLLNGIDIALTLYFVGSGVSYELNPLMAKVLAWPLPLILVFKILVPAGLVLCMLQISKYLHWDKLNFRTVLIAIVACELSICLFNLSGLFFR